VPVSVLEKTPATWGADPGPRSRGRLDRIVLQPARSVRSTSAPGSVGMPLMSCGRSRSSRQARSRPGSRIAANRRAPLRTCVPPVNDDDGLLAVRGWWRRAALTPPRCRRRRDVFDTTVCPSVIRMWSARMRASTSVRPAAATGTSQRDRPGMERSRLRRNWPRRRHRPNRA